MEAYTDFAAVYDTFMDDTPYDVWGDFVAGLIERYGISKPVESDKGKRVGGVTSCSWAGEWIDINDVVAGEFSLDKIQVYVTSNTNQVYVTSNKYV